MNDRFPHAHATTRGPGARRSGPVSRLYRLAIAVLLGWGVLGLLGEGLTGFSEAPVPRQPTLWILTAVAFLGLHDGAEMWLGGRGRLAVTIVGGALIAAAGVSLLGSGQLWDAPLTWLVYAFDLAMAGLVSVANLVSIVLGTPGCELGALSELLARLRGRYDAHAPTLHSCSGGLDGLDRWESRRDDGGTHAS